MLFANSCLMCVMLCLSSLWHMVQSLANPQRDFEACGNSRQSLICDPHNYLTDELRKVIDYKLANLLFKTHCFCRSACATTLLSRLVIGVAVMEERELPQYESNDLDQRMALFADATLRNWTLGACGTNDALILALVSTQSLDTRISFRPNTMVARTLDPHCLDMLNKQHSHAPNHIVEMIDLVE
ncbi:hypothetical protein Ciccas_013127 [Cichlidogyrus casuarinus]|uniref:Uncharacterized protein n=1 Tax=Cichlidogyrus casuarinus TaxID=1844966 RepID=A0ABD2PMV1_9PLAT